MRQVAIFFVRMYQALQGSFYTGNCRFHPTCSHYSIEAFETRGFFIGLALTTYRILRCQPFCKGGWDPVPRDPVPQGPVARRHIFQVGTVSRNSFLRESAPRYKHFRSLP